MIDLAGPQSEIRRDGSVRRVHSGRLARILGLLVVLVVSSYASGQSQDPVADVGRKLDTILRRLEDAAAPGQRRKVLDEVVGRLESLLTEVHTRFRSLPGRRAEQERIEFHLRYLITWTRFLAKKSHGAQAEPDRPAQPRSPDMGQIRAMLKEAAQYEKDHPEDRTGIVDRYLKILPLARGTGAEQEVVKHLNRVWDREKKPEPGKGNEPASESEPRSTDPKTGKAAGAQAEPSPEPKPEIAPRTKKTNDDAAPATPAAALTPDDLKALRDELADGDTEARIRAAIRLAAVEQSWVGKFLVDRLAEEQDERVQKELVRVVAGRPDRHVIRALERWARAKDERLRRVAVNLLGTMNTREAGKALAAFVTGDDLGTIRQVVRVARTMQDGHGVTALARVARDFTGLRFEVIEALGETRHESAARVLVSFLHRRKYAEFKDPAMRALRMIGPEAIVPLIDALEGRDYRQYAAAALRSVTGERFGMSRNRWLQWWRQNRKRFAGDKK